jgi:hypothetical protein
MFDAIMTRFTPPLRFTIPALIVVSGFSIGAIQFVLEVQDANRRAEQSSIINLKSSASQTARMVDYLYRTDDEADQVVSLISRLGANPGYLSVRLFSDRNIVLRSSEYNQVGHSIALTDAAPMAFIFSQARRTLRGTVCLSQDRSYLSAVYPILLKPLPGELMPSRVGLFYVKYGLTEAKTSAFREALGRALLFLIR